MAIDFKSGPYYDDFDPLNNFYKVLFKPGYAVQARELNQLQSILQHQVSSLGNHIFKKNSIVIPGGISLNTAAEIVSIVDINDPSVLVGRTITNAEVFDYQDDTTLDGFITAVVLGYKPAVSLQEPAALYIKYFKSQEDGRSTFNLSESLKTVDSSMIEFKVDSSIGSTIGKVATISRGTFYTKEVFVDTEQQSVIVDITNSTITNAVIGLNVIESIITSDDDISLLDNANGSPNEYAPGADRYKIQLVLTRLDADTVIDDENFIKMMNIENDVVTFINSSSQYSELMNMIARRTYDANGNFIVTGLDTSITESSSDSYVNANVTTGRCYLGGYVYDQIVETPISLIKPRGSAYQQQLEPRSTYTSDMTYFYVAGGSYLKELPLEDSLVQFLNADPSSPGATVIGYGIFKDIQYAFGTAGVNDVYKMFFDYISLEKDSVIGEIGGIKAITANQGAPVLHQLRLSGVSGSFGVGNNITPAAPVLDENQAPIIQTGVLYYFANNYAYLIKNTAFDIPQTDRVIDTTTNAEGTRVSTFVSNYSTASLPMFEVDSSVVKTLFNSDGDNLTSYSIVRRDARTITSLGPIITTITDGTFEDFSSSDYFAFDTTAGEEKFINLEGIISITNNGSSYVLDIQDTDLVGKTLWVYSTVNKTNVIQAEKNLVTIEDADVIHTPSSSWMALSKQDVVDITKIVAGKTIAIESATWSANTATIVCTEAHNLSANDYVVIKGISSSNNASGVYNSGFNGVFKVKNFPVDNLQLAFNFDLTTNPGTVEEGAFELTGDSRDATVALPPDINNDTDVTTSYTFDSGNTAYLSGTGTIKLKKGVIAPLGQIAVKYRYYSLTGNSYVSVDSYGTHTSDDLSYIGRIKDVKDNIGRSIELRRYIDFRTRPSNYFFKNIGSIASGSNKLVLNDLNLSYYNTKLEGKYVVGPSHLDGATIAVGGVVFNPDTGNTELTLSSNAVANFTGTYYIGLNGTGLSLIDNLAGAVSFEKPKDSTKFTYQCVKFKPRHLMIYVNRVDDLLKVDFKEVKGREEVVRLQRNENKLPLAYVYMKPYTLTVRDVILEKIENPVYQMLDIHNLKNRLDRTEYYASLALNKDIETEIRNAANEDLTETSRGFWSENFNDITVHDYQSDDFKCTIHDTSHITPGVVTRTLPLDVDTTQGINTWQRTGTAITLPYTENRAISNENASRFNNLNPYNIVNWSSAAKLVLNPSVDNWIDITSEPSQTVNNTVVNAIATAATVSTSTAVAQQTTTQVSIPTPIVISLPPVIIPAPPIVEIVNEVNIEKTSWGPDSAGGRHAITFTWLTNTGRTGRVNTDIHLSKIIAEKGYDGTYAKSLVGKGYNDAGVKEYLNAGTHFDQKAPRLW